jgi:hypothetical protein
LKTRRAGLVIVVPLYLYYFFFLAVQPREQISAGSGEWL